jgi:hypothetical protein
MARDESRNEREREGEGDERFLNRWARRKAEPAAAPAPDAPAQAPEPVPVEEIVARLPPVESILPGADMAAGVPAELRTAALDRLWRIDPAIRNRVADAIDYAEDYNAPHTIPGFGPAARAEVEAVVRRLAGLDAPPQPPRADEPPAEPCPPPVAAAPDSGRPVSDAPDEPPPAPARLARRHGGALPS